MLINMVSHGGWFYGIVLLTNLEILRIEIWGFKHQLSDCDGDMVLPGLVNIPKTDGKITMLLMGKSTK